MQLFRELVVSTLEDEENAIGSKDVIVEIDESKFGVRKYHKGRLVDDAWVIGSIEHNNKRNMFLRVVKKRDADIIKDIIVRYVKPGSIIMTDCWREYKDLEELGVTHMTVNYNECFVDPETGAHTNTIEGTWGGVKLKVRSRNHNKGLIDNHLLEFIWRCRNEDNL
ncbi:4928_t:CDS:1 [Acaulospora colombiana]|uniref:4928_t:CDS:1 n=1 Tax=Acaulospora colombiana TaxID=27376 RepID=A0ACA9N576_9GLOM|nr:4928_t:CDS:1 [Acaulospora colombiana]